MNRLPRLAAVHAFCAFVAASRSVLAYTVPVQGITGWPPKSDGVAETPTDDGAQEQR